jgi:hypothetical protein
MNVIAPIMTAQPSISDLVIPFQQAPLTGDSPRQGVGKQRRWDTTTESTIQARILVRVSIRYAIGNSPKQEGRYDETDVVLIGRLVGLEVRDSQEIGTDDNVGDDSQVITCVRIPGQMSFRKGDLHVTHRT